MCLPPSGLCLEAGRVSGSSTETWSKACRAVFSVALPGAGGGPGFGGGFGGVFGGGFGWVGVTIPVPSLKKLVQLVQENG